MVASLVRKTLQTKPNDGKHWTIREITSETRLYDRRFTEFLHAIGLQPHRQRYFKLSTDPFIIEKVRDIVGIYLSPPENAVVLCVDETIHVRWRIHESLYAAQACISSIRTISISQKDYQPKESINGLSCSPSVAELATMLRTGPFIQRTLFLFRIFGERTHEQNEA